MATNVETLCQLSHVKFKASTSACGEGCRLIRCVCTSHLWGRIELQLKIGSISRTNGSKNAFLNIHPDPPLAPGEL
jgi:hypothetical protein